MAGGAYRPGHDHDTAAELMVRFRGSSRAPVRARKIEPVPALAPLSSGRARCACGASVALTSSGQTMRAHRAPNGDPCPLRWTGNTVQLDQLPPVSASTSQPRRHGPAAPIPVQLPDIVSAPGLAYAGNTLSFHASTDGVSALCHSPLDTSSPTGELAAVTCRRCRSTRLFRAALRAAAQDA